MDTSRHIDVYAGTDAELCALANALRNEVPQYAEAIMLQEDPARTAHLVLVDNPDHHRDGDFVLRNGVIEPEGAPRLTFSGIGIYRPEFFHVVPRGEKTPLAPLLHAAIGDHLVSGEHYRGRWVDVGTPERLAQLNQAIDCPVST